MSLANAIGFSIQEICDMSDLDVVRLALSVASFASHSHYTQTGLVNPVKARQWLIATIKTL